MSLSAAQLQTLKTDLAANNNTILVTGVQAGFTDVVIQPYVDASLVIFAS